ncbi:hypothetical protein [Paraburkholderia sp. HD33-4]|uniref:hypothetical protein n=1 Tax=Paraburkholderia sp. HD33-4 TaxID=2883242 RepID=UPI001F3BB031|nr:hypothetical protein [Paraburkholderia sp. HD33-4]
MSDFRVRGHSSDARELLRDAEAILETSELRAALELRLESIKKLNKIKSKNQINIIFKVPSLRNAVLMGVVDFYHDATKLLLEIETRPLIESYLLHSAETGNPVPSLFGFVEERILSLPFQCDASEYRNILDRAGEQLLALLLAEKPWPAVRVGGIESLIIVSTQEDSSHKSSSLERVQTETSAIRDEGFVVTYIQAEKAIPVLCASILKRLSLKMESRGYRKPEDESLPANVEVSNYDHGWLVFRRQQLDMERRGFGGPTYPVPGYLNPGDYFFGIENGRVTWWDTATLWTVPEEGIVRPFLPYPPEKAEEYLENARKLRSDDK